MENRKQKQNTLDFQEVTYPICISALFLSEETRFSISMYALCAKFVLCQLPKPLPGNFDNLISFYWKTYEEVALEDGMLASFSEKSHNLLPAKTVLYFSYNPKFYESHK